MSDHPASSDASLAARAHRLALELPLSALADDTVDRSVTRIVNDLAPLADAVDQGLLAARVVDRLRGLGPLEELLHADGVTDVMINGPGPIWVERDGQLEATALMVDALDIDHLVERMVAPLGRRLDRTSPLVDGRLADGSRVHVAAAPVGVDGPYVTIRRFQVHEVDLIDVASPGTAAMLRWAMAARSNILVSGGTGSGKTTLLNALAAHVGDGQRVVTIEDAAELRLAANHVVRLEARPSMVDGPPAITIRELVRNALRMRPDRIIVGEVRGPEAIDMLQAMNTGHDGSLSTVHANSPVDALRRLEALVLMDSSLPQAVVREHVVSAIDLVVHMGRGADGGRRIEAVAEPLHKPDFEVRELSQSGEGLRALPTRTPRRRGEAPHTSWIERCP